MTNVYKQFNWIWVVASCQKQKGISAPQNLQKKTMWVWDVDWQTEGILCLLLRQVNLTAQINPTRQSGDTHTPNSAAVCTNSCVCVCVGRGRQRCSPLQHCLLKKKQEKKKEKKDETFHPIYSNAARHRKALASSCRCRQDLEVGVECGGRLSPGLPAKLI